MEAQTEFGQAIDELKKEIAILFDEKKVHSIEIYAKVASLPIFWAE